MRDHLTEGETWTKGELTLDHAQRLHRQAGWKRYQGPRIEGERFTISIEDAAYPSVLRDLQHPPEMLYGIGSRELLTRKSISVIGARNATPYGIACVEKFAGIAAQRDVVIVSGGARGCDSAAHTTALKYGTPTIAVLGGGCDQPYPARNSALFQDIVNAQGLILSEHAWDFPPLPYTFRKRNRIIAALSRALLIVEASIPSGTFSTADEALACGREVLVVPGAITSPTSAGSNRLLYQGATPIVDTETFEDVLFSQFGILKQRDSAKEDQMPVFDCCTDARACKAVWLALCAEPLRTSQLASLLQTSLGSKADTRIFYALSSLEALGYVCRYPDGRYGPIRVE